MAYKVMLPTYVCLFIALAAQGCWYEPDHQVRRHISTAYASLATFLVMFLVIDTFFVYNFGRLAGWLGITILATCDAPQVYKNYRRQSTQGFSFLFPSIVSVGAVIELCLAIYLQFPWQTVLNSMRALTYYAIYCFQFYTYSSRR